MDWVQWFALGNAFDDLSLYNKIRVLKFQHNWLPTAKWLQRLYRTESAACPVCAKEVETWKHMFQCKHDTACTAKLHMVGKL
eukprot:14302654-Ditylum_brightwellii.AAC.1